VVEHDTKQVDLQAAQAEAEVDNIVVHSAEEYCRLGTSDLAEEDTGELAAVAASQNCLDSMVERWEGEGPRMPQQMR